MHVGINLLVLNALPPGGTGYHAISLFEALVEAEETGATTARVTGFATGEAVRYFSPLARRRLRLLPTGGGVQRVLNELVRLPREAKRAGVDMVVNPAFLGAPWSGRRRALIVHDLYFRSDPLLVPVRRRLLLRMVVPLLGRASDPIFAVSGTTKTQLERHYPALGARTQVLYSGNRAVGTAPAPPRTLIAHPYLLMVGHLTANKLPETAVTALAELRREGRDLMLLHIGDDGGRLAPLAAAAGISADVATLGRQSDDVLAHHYAHCAALVIPSIREGFGLPLLEAQAHGAPVIASDCDALTEISGGAALFFPVDDPVTCAAAIRQILDFPACRDDMVERGRANAATFRWERTARELLTALGMPRRASASVG